MARMRETVFRRSNAPIVLRAANPRSVIAAGPDDPGILTADCRLSDLFRRQVGQIGDLHYLLGKGRRPSAGFTSRPLSICAR